MKDNDSRLQDPKVTVTWALAGLKRAILELGDSPTEQRVRSQLLQLILALERDGYDVEGDELIRNP